MPEALLTGAGGFVGRALAAVLPGSATLSLGVPDWEARLAAASLEGAVIFHLAARVHAPDDRDEAAFHHDNVEKTLRLATEGARRGARRLVFLSSIKAQADESAQRPLRPDDPPTPMDAYGRSKLAAERALADAGLPVVVVRAPLVMGAGAKGNLENLIALADSAWPLPLAQIANRRSFVHVDDLARLLVACGRRDEAPGHTFLAAHPASWSTPQLVAGLRRELGRPERLFRVPPALLEGAAAALGRGRQMQRLTRSLECDATATTTALGWQARIGLDEATREMARAWRKQRQ